MKSKFGTFFSSALLMMSLVGCVHDDDPYVPARRSGFRPPSTPLNQEDLPPVDPFGVPTDATPDSPQAPSGGISGSSAVVSPLPDPAPVPAPAPKPESKPEPKPEPKPDPKPAAPEYAKRVPGKPNWIKSPYDGRILDATGFPPGTEVKDPVTGKIMLVP